MKKVILGSLLCIAALSCVTSQKASHIIADKNKIPLIEYFTIVEGEALSGTPFPGRRIDSPGYSFDSTSKVLDIYRNSSVDTANVILFLGLGKALKGTAGQGVSSNIVSISNLPYSLGELVIYRITDNSVGLTFKEKSINLLTGQNYSQTETHIDTLVNNTIIKTKTTWRILHRGFVDMVKR